MLINFATFGDGGDVGRWAAISTMWIAIPAMVGMLIVQALIAGIIYLLARLLNIMPAYTAMVQGLTRDLYTEVKRYGTVGFLKSRLV